MKNKSVDVADAVQAALFPHIFLTKKLLELASSALDSYKDIDSSTTTSLREQAERNELEQRIKQANAKIAQEYAIAARIQAAEEVEMEEFYEYVGGGSGGIQANFTSGDVGLNASGEIRRVSKRVYRFKGGLKIDALSDPD